ncbi:flagellar hook-basal body complex protein FliE, partial [Pseudomonas aeruginosa]|uniref:flagellar hook-basal body complex protein FliE n=1 Tax=Pseudomonas aeruginosa TaxID=287 RepID=UPI003CC6D71D
KAKPVLAAAEGGGPSFSEKLSQAVDKVNETQQASTAMANAVEVGQSGVDLTDEKIASQKASVSFQAMTQVRNKLVQA